jgi:type II secretory pathway component PulC
MKSQARWIANLLGGAVGVCLSTYIVYSLQVEAAKQPTLQGEVQVRPPELASPARTFGLDVGKLARAFGLPEPVVRRESAERSSQTPVRSSLHASLVGTALAVPSSYSLCLLTNGNDNETAVYRIGDTFMGARIHAIRKDRVLVENQGSTEYIDHDDLTTIPSAATYRVIPEGNLQEVEPLTPQG